MGKIKVIELHERIFADHDRIAERIRDKMSRQKTLFLNFMSAPGSGKTTTLIALAEVLKQRYTIGNINVDIRSSLDAERVAGTVDGLSFQINNGGLCHIDADMVERALADYDTWNLDLLFFENIGNLVCPAEFDIGSHKNIMLFSVPEGDDKPLKYPLMFQKSDLVLINKIDTLPYFDFDLEKAEQYIHARNPNIKIIPVSAKTGEGIDRVAAWIEENYEVVKQNRSY